MATTTYASPGVYVEEIHNAVRPIEAVGTSLPAFVGITEEASLKRVNTRTGRTRPIESVLNRAILIGSWTQYSQIFGGLVPGIYLPDAVYAHFTNGGGACYIMSIRAIAEVEGAVAASTDVAAGKGKTGFTVTAKTAGEGANGTTVTITREKGADGKDTNTFTMKAGSESLSGLSMKKADAKFIGEVSFNSVAISNITGSAMPDAGKYRMSGGGLPRLTATNFIGDALSRTGIAGLEPFDEIRLVACPDLMTLYDGSDEASEQIKIVQQAMIDHCENMRYRFAVLDTPPNMNAQEARDWREFLGFDTSYAAMYYPWVRIGDLVTGGTKLVPPSGHVVGMYGRVDGERGTHKAPANEQLRGVTDLEIQLSKTEQAILNPIGVNCIRAFPNRGIRVWGARTLSSDGAWRYISVRRLFIMVAASMDTGLQWAVFEPNTQRLWMKITRDVNSFLRQVWNSGGLFGESPEEAYYIKCDAELNTEEVRDAGQLIVEVGIAPVKPAEFIIFRLSQWSFMEDEEDEEDEEGDGENDSGDTGSEE